MSNQTENRSIGEVVKATGLTEATLRAWERRHGFPAPDREPSGHRRYSAAQVEQIARVVELRSRGLSVGRAIEQVAATPTSAPSFYAMLRDRHRALDPTTTTKRYLLALSHSIEEESAARAERAILIGGFQRERFYRASERRWRELSEGAAHTFALADFKRRRSRRGAPTEVPLGAGDPALREWVLICVAPEHSVCMVAWEPPGREPDGDSRRELELLFSLRPDVVRSAARVALSILASRDPEKAAAVEAYLEELVDPDPKSQLDLSGGITARLLQTLTAEEAG
jgi:MerR family transcriptional regulator, light-induced transcriptional regulator